MAREPTSESAMIRTELADMKTADELQAGTKGAAVAIFAKIREAFREDGDPVSATSSKATKAKKPKAVAGRGTSKDGSDASAS